MVSDELKKQAKKGGVKLTYMRGGKRYKKTEKMLSRQLKKKGGGTLQASKKGWLEEFKELHSLDYLEDILEYMKTIE